MAKTKIHVTPDGPKECSASIKTCTYAQNGGEHYDNMDDAQAVYDKQMKKEHGSFSVKKTSTKNNSGIHITKEDISEALKNSNIETAINSRYSHKNDVTTNYVKEILQQGDLNEIVEKINSEHDRLENSPRINMYRYYKEIADSQDVHDNAVIDNGDGYYNRFDEDTDSYDLHVYEMELDENRIFLKTKTKPGYEPAVPLNREYTSKEVKENDSDDEESTVVTYSYEINDEDKEKLSNQHKFNAIRNYKEIVDDPSKPNWMILPKQNNVETKAEGYDDYDSKYGPNGDKHHINPNKLIQELNVKIDDLNKRKKEIIEDDDKELKRYQAIRDDSATKFEQLKDIRKNDPYNKEYLLEEANLESFNENLKRHKAAMKKRQNSLDREIFFTKNVIETLDKRVKDDKKLMIEDNIAARYPSNDPKKRREAAQKWMKDNEKHLQL